MNSFQELVAALQGISNDGTLPDKLRQETRNLIWQIEKKGAIHPSIQTLLEQKSAAENHVRKLQEEAAFWHRTALTNMDRANELEEWLRRVNPDLLRRAHDEGIIKQSYGKADMKGCTHGHEARMDDPLCFPCHRQDALRDACQDVCAMCGGRACNYEREVEGPNAAGNYTHYSAYYDWTQLCVASSIRARIRFEEAKIQEQLHP